MEGSGLHREISGAVRQENEGTRVCFHSHSIRILLLCHGVDDRDSYDSSSHCGDGVQMNEMSL